MKNIKNMDDFNEFVKKIQKENFYREPIAWGFCRSEKGRVEANRTLSASFAVVNYKENNGSAAVILWALNEYATKKSQTLDVGGSELVFTLNEKVLDKIIKVFEFLIDETGGEKHRNLQNLLIMKEVIEASSEFEDDPNHEFRVAFMFADELAKSVEVAYLKLYLLSLNKVAIRSLNLNGIFALLPNLAWDEYSKPFELQWLRENEIWLKMNGIYPKISSVDKFPRYLSHVIPADNVRILDDAKVRMGASLGAGTTIMPGASYVNFNSGTTGGAMVEGRISSSVIVGEGTDIGGGASILGVLSGTNGNPISIGKRCLLGANSVTGIPLGDDCIVDGGIAILEGTKVFISEKERANLAKVNADFKFDREIYKGLELAGLNGLHFRQNSQNGQITASLSKRAIKLNEDLH